MNKINVGITGFTGFIGKSLINFFYIKPEINLILLDDEDFNDKKRIEFFVKNTDVIIHLAAITDAAGSIDKAEELEANNFQST